MKKSLVVWGVWLGAVLVFAAAALFLRVQLTAARAEYPTAPIENPLAAENTFGTTVDLTLYSDTDLFPQLDAMQSARLAWLRIPIRWAEIEPQRGQFHWDALDHAIEAARLRGFKLVAVLETAPEWARPAGSPPETPPLEVGDFADFASTVARRYAGDIAVFQIWHEPNLSAQWGNRFVSPAEYTILLKNAAFAIRGAQPDAKIMAASLAPTLENGPLNVNEPEFLRGMYVAGAASYFDILGAELLGFHLPVEESTPTPDELNIRRVELLRGVMVENGDTRTPIWATAFGWHALPADWGGQPPTIASDVPEKQATRTANALDFARKNWDWLGVIFATRWDATGLAADDPARGFALSPDMLAPFSSFAQIMPGVATPGHYSATHISGQYSPGWKFGGGTADIPHPDTDSAPTLTLPFDGTRLDLRVNRGDFQGYLWVTIDGNPANALPRDESGRAYVVLSDPLRQSAAVTLARYLPDGAHTAVITAEGGWGQWAIAGWDVFREPDTRRPETVFGVALALFALATIGFLGMTIRHRKTLRAIDVHAWRWLVERTNNIRTAHIALGMGALAAGMVFLSGKIALLLLPVLAALMLIRVEAGAMLVAASISFFLAKIHLPGITVSLVEMELALLVAAIGLRLILPHPQHPDTLPVQTLWRLNWLSAGDWLAAGLVALGGITTIWAENHGVALYEWRTVVIGGTAFYFALRLLPKITGTPIAPLAQSLIEAFAAGAVLHAASAIHHYIFFPQNTITAEGVHRALGYLYGSPNNLSLFLERAFPFLVVFSIWGKGWRRWLNFGGLIIVSVAVYLTFSKGTLLLAIPATLIFIALLTGGKRAWLGAGTGLILLATSLVPLSQTARFRNTFSLQPGSTGYARLQLWQSAGQMFREHWLTGLGLDNFLYQYRTRYILPSAWTEPNLSHPHNLLLDFGTRLGIGGVAWILAAQIRFWWLGLRGYFATTGATRYLRLALMASMIPFLVHGMVDNAFFLVDLAYTFFFSIALIENFDAGRITET